MPLLRKGDLTLANSSGAFMNALMNDQEDTQDLINNINEFISSSTDHLKGDAYDAVRAHLETYIPILQIRIKTASSIMDALKSANNSMIDYMESESVLDTSELEGLQSEYNTYRNLAERSLSYIDGYVTQEAKDEARAQAYRYNSMADGLKKKIELLENLASKDNAVYNSLSSLESEITAFKNVVSDINPIKYSIK